MLEWEWFGEPNTLSVFVFLLLSAKREMGTWRDILLEPGQCVTSRAKIAQSTGLSEQQVRTSLEHLKSTNEITIESTNQFTIITINNYVNYQFVGGNEQPTIQPTEPPTNNQPSNQPSNKNIRNKELDIFEKDNINIIQKETTTKRFVKPTIEQVEAYCKERRNGIDARSFMDYYESVGWKVGNKPMKDWRAAVRTWERNRKPDKPQPQQTQLTIEDEFAKYGEQAEFMRQYVAKDRADKQREMDRIIQRNMDKLKQQKDNNDE